MDDNTGMDLTMNNFDALYEGRFFIPQERSIIRCIMYETTSGWVQHYIDRYMAFHIESSSGRRSA